MAQIAYVRPLLQTQLVSCGDVTLKYRTVEGKVGGEEFTFYWQSCPNNMVGRIMTWYIQQRNDRSHHFQLARV